MTEQTFRVTRSCIDTGGHCVFNCAIALALKKGGVFADVHPVSIVHKDWIITTSPTIKRWIFKYDNGLDVKPFSFTIDWNGLSISRVTL